MKHSTKSYIARSIILSITVLLIIYYTSFLSIEFLWFDQLEFIDVLLRRWFIQILSIIASLIFIIILYNWRSKWIRTISNKVSSDKGNLIGNYTLRLTISYLTILSTFGGLIYLSFSKYNDLHIAQSINSSIFNLLIENITLLFTIAISLLIALLFKLGRKVILFISNILFTITLLRNWITWSLFFNIPDSGYTEPLFNTDISYSIGRYPAISLFSSVILIFTLLVYSISYWDYLVLNNCLANWSAPKLNSKQRKLSKSILAFIGLIASLKFWLSRYTYLWSDHGLLPGAGWLDINFNIPIRNIIAILVLIFTITYVLNINKSVNRYIRNTSIIISTFLFLFQSTLSPLLQWLLVKPRELSLEKEYLNRSIVSTRRAFQLDSIKTKMIKPLSRLTNKDLSMAESTLRNIRLWDSQPLLDTNKQLQQFRVYYKFSTASVDRYKLRDNTKEKEQVIIATRELDLNSLPDSSRTWLNKHFVFTHGYGFTTSPVNTKGKDGLPDYFIKNLGKSTIISGNNKLGITSKSVRDNLRIGNAAIYYGLLTDSYVVAPTKLKELDYPEGNKNIFTNYKGTGGILLNSIWRKVIASIYLSEPRLLNTDVLSNNSRLLIRRQIKDRVSKIAPFIDFIGDPYFVSTSIKQLNNDYQTDQFQYWIIEGYTKSSTYPYASKTEETNLRYIRNSVKAVVDAYNGTVNFYISEPEDPIIRAWDKIFPGMFNQINDIPYELREHLRVPRYLFEIKVKQLLRYHVTDVRTFYTGDDIWQVPKEMYGRKQIPVKPYHITAQLKPNINSEFLLLQPLAPLARPNLSAWLAARNDGDKYGELVLLRFPNETNIFGPEQIQALINQNPEISQQFSLWDRAGSEVIQGNLLVLPVGNALLYVEPVYLKASNGGLPTLTRVVVSDGKRISMKENLQDGIRELIEDFPNY